MARGHNAERKTAAILRAADHLVASRRHEPGPGDLLAWTPHVAKNGRGRSLVEVPPLLVEVKHTADPYDHFAPRDREECLLYAEDYGLEVILAWWPSGSNWCVWIPPDEWPQNSLT